MRPNKQSYVMEGYQPWTNGYKPMETEKRDISKIKLPTEGSGQSSLKIGNRGK